MNILNKALLAAALGLAIACPTFSQDDSSSLFADSGSSTVTSTLAAAAASVTSFTLNLAGSHEFSYHFPAYDRSYSYDGTITAPSLSNEFDITLQDKEIKLVSDWNGTLWPLVADAKGEYGSWGQLIRARPLENYVSWNPSGFKLAAGYQMFSWGVADKYNPTDNLNPRDYTVGVNADKIPALALDAVWYPSDAISVEGVFEPSAQTSIYPVDFASETDAGASSVSTMIAQLAYLKGASYNVTDTIADSPVALKPENAIAGGKINYRSSVIDVSLSYLYDIDPYYTPVISTVVTPTSVTSANVVSTITLERKRIHHFGLDAKTTLGKFGLWTEAAYNLTQNDGSSGDYATRKSNLNYVVGADFNFGADDSGYLNLQYIGTWIPGYDDSFYRDLAAGKITDPQEAYERALVNSLGLATEGLIQGATVNLKYEFGKGVVTPQLTAVYARPFLYDDTKETRYGSLALNPEIDLMPVDSFHIKVGADLAYAWVKPAGGDLQFDTTTDKVGIYTTSNNVYLKILYKWSLDLKK
jgi:hypothetical protein